MSKKPTKKPQVANPAAIDEKTEELIKKTDAVLNDPAPQAPDPTITPPVPPQGRLAATIVRTAEQAAKLPPKLRQFVLDNDGNPLPEWVQIKNLMNRPHKKVAIVGFADTKNLAPYNDPTFEIWGLNDLHNSIPRADRWFDIHPRSNIEEDTNLLRNRGQTPPDTIGLAGLRKLNVPIYMQDRYEDVPNSLKFPLKEIMDAFPYGNYMTNSISYMTALAIYEGFEVIDIYGVDMAVGTEYVDQRPSCEYWVGVAVGRGIKVHIPAASDLLKCRFMYAFEEIKQDAFNQKIQSMLKNMSERHSTIVSQAQQARDAQMQYEGAMGAVKEINKIWANLGDKL